MPRDTVRTTCTASTRAAACGGALLTAVAIAGLALLVGLRPGEREHAVLGMRPYAVDGVVYVPRAEAGYDAVGIASWYGPSFHGRQTANGEVFDMNALTAAHPTLPLGSRVRVTNLANGRSTILRINDRGPFVDRRLIDLSRRAAEILGFRRQGLASVRLEALSQPL